MTKFFKTALVAALSTQACASSDATPPPDPTAPEKPESSKPEGRVIELSSRAPAPEVHPGDTLTWSIADSSHSVDPRHRTEWGSPSVSGDAIKFVRREHDPSDMPGDHDTNTYVYEAVKPGKATLRASASGFESKTKDEEPPELVIEIEVTPAKSP